MHVVVCLSCILDPELPSSRFRLLEDQMGVADNGIPHTMSPFDEAALEVSLQVRDQASDTMISAASVGLEEADDVLRRALGLKADNAVRVDAGLVDMQNPVTVATKLKAAIVALETPPDVVLIGREYGDWDDGTIPPLLAEELGMGYVGLIHALHSDQDGITAERERKETIETIRAPIPFVASVTNYPSNRIRMPILKNVVMARRRPITLVDGAAVDDQRVGLTLNQLQIPERKSACRMLEGEPQEQAAELASVLQEWMSTGGR